MFQSRIVPCSTYPATVPGGHSTVISWFRHGQQKQLSHLEEMIDIIFREDYEQVLAGISNTEYLT